MIGPNLALRILWLGAQQIVKQSILFSLHWEGKYLFNIHYYHDCSHLIGNVAINNIALHALPNNQQFQATNLWTPFVWISIWFGRSKWTFRNMLVMERLEILTANLKSRKSCSQWQFILESHFLKLRQKMKISKGMKERKFASLIFWMYSTRMKTLMLIYRLTLSGSSSVKMWRITNNYDRDRVMLTSTEMSTFLQ